MIKTSDRFQYLDGLRGIACLMVVADHYSRAFQPAQPIKPYCDGGLSVGIFFLMSGFVLTDSFGRCGSRIYELLVARISRLLAPTILAVTLASALYWIFQPLAHAAALSSSSQWFWCVTGVPSIAEFPGSLLAAVVGFSDTAFFGLHSFISSYQSSDAPIWTISYEIYGSILTLALTKLYHFRRPWWYLVLVVGLSLFGMRELGLFVIGHIARVFWQPDQAGKINRAALLVGTLVLAVLAFTHVDLYRARPILEVAMSGMFPHASPLNAANAVAGALVFAIMIYSRTIQSVLSIESLTSLGRLSFSIYLIHWPIMLGFGSSLYLLIGNRSAAATWTVFVAGAIITGMIAVAFERYVDAPVIAASRRFKRRWQAIGALPIASRQVAVVRHSPDA